LSVVTILTAFAYPIAANGKRRAGTARSSTVPSNLYRVTSRRTPLGLVPASLVTNFVPFENAVPTIDGSYTRLTDLRAIVIGVRNLAIRRTPIVIVRVVVIAQFERLEFTVATDTLFN
jgi:hypothetical protein